MSFCSTAVMISMIIGVRILIAVCLFTVSSSRAVPVCAAS